MSDRSPDPVVNQSCGGYAANQKLANGTAAPDHSERDMSRDTETQWKHREAQPYSAPTKSIARHAEGTEYEQNMGNEAHPYGQDFASQNERGEHNAEPRDSAARPAETERLRRAGGSGD